MPHSSPIMKTSLELFTHAIEHFIKGDETDCRLSVLHLAHALELAVKACLVNHNISIYEKDNRTLSIHNSFRLLKAAWNLPPEDEVPHKARVELLIDERNAVQHRYGTIDFQTMQYHMRTAYDFMQVVLQIEYAIDIRDLMLELLPEETSAQFSLMPKTEGSKSRFLTNNELTKPDLEPGHLLIEMVASWEEIISSAARDLYDHKGPLPIFSIISSALSCLPEEGKPENWEKLLPQMIHMRNAAIHKRLKFTRDEINKLIPFYVATSKYFDDHITDLYNVVSNYVPDEIKLKAKQGELYT